MRDNAKTFTPELIDIEAQVCLRSWDPTTLGRNGFGKVGRPKSNPQHDANGQANPHDPRRVLASNADDPRLLVPFGIAGTAAMAQ